MSHTVCGSSSAQDATCAFRSSCSRTAMNRATFKPTTPKPHAQPSPSPRKGTAKHLKRRTPVTAPVQKAAQLRRTSSVPSPSSQEERGPRAIDALPPSSVAKGRAFADAWSKAENEVYEWKLKEFDQEHPDLLSWLPLALGTEFLEFYTSSRLTASQVRMRATVETKGNEWNGLHEASVVTVFFFFFFFFVFFEINDASIKSDKKA